jgi:carbonic anhydrase
MKSLKEIQASITPARALELLREGNQRFSSGVAKQRDYLAQVERTAGGQWPFAVVFGCIDSRVPAEIVFDQGVGDLFIARVAGNVPSEDVIGSMEFACKVAGAKLVLVLGHTSCGAVKGACDGVELGNLTGLLAKIGGAISATSVPAAASARTSANADFVNAVARNNVSATVDALLERSQILRELRDDDRIAVVGAMYDVETGVVEFLG